MDQLMIRNSTNDRFFARGKSLFRGRSVYDMEVKDWYDETCISAHVMGDSGIEYSTEVFFNEKRITGYYCTCPASETYEDMCKHAVAVALTYVMDTQKKTLLQEDRCDFSRSKSLKTDPTLKRILYNCSMEKQAKYLQQEVTGQIEIEPHLLSLQGEWLVEFRIGSERKYVLKDIYAFAEAMEKHEKFQYGKFLSFIHEKSAFTMTGGRIAEFLVDCIRQRKALHQREKSMYSFYYAPKARVLSLTDNEMVRLLDILKGKDCILGDSKGTASAYLAIREEDPYLVTELKKEDASGYILRVPAFLPVCGQEGMYLICRDTAYRCSDEFREAMEPFCTGFNSGKEQELQLAEQDMSVFCTSLYPQISRFTDFHCTEDLSRFMPEACTVKIFLDKEDGLVTCRLESLYGEKKHNLLKELETADLYRDLAAEGLACTAARAYFPQEAPEEGFLWFGEEQDELLYQLLTSGIRQLSVAGEVYVSDALRQIRVNRIPEVGVSIDLKGGLLGLEFSSEQMPYEEMEELLASYRLKKKFHRLKDGSFFMLEDSSLETIAELTDGLELTKKALKTGSIQVPRYRSFYIDQVLKESASLDIRRSSAYKELIRSIKSVEDSDFPVPEILRNTLRRYQKDGYRWLMTMEALGFGGILADDMGLGKSLQMLTFLYAKMQEDPLRTSLLVCPASLVYNWEDEVNKFVPDLKTCIIAGTAAERKRLLEESCGCHLLITSYDLLKRDITLYEGKEFYCQVLDEAQNIKNHTTKAAKAVKEIHAQVRFALTGTPIENRLSELWSIFDFLMPGILGSYRAFRGKYELPITQKQDKLAAKRLQRMIGPFLLRRLKQDVLKDLPEKSETLVYSKLEGKQRELYQANAQKLMQTIKGSGVGDKIKILAGLTRLRQLCCDPHLLYEDYEGEAAKLETCMELVRTAVAGGHKLLLFSQFTSMLDIIKERLSQEGIASYMLTGATSKKQRIQLVKEFNQADVPVFLISLKAGGTGLNLTAASIVIHFDPWWNLAAQNQATDRAHRIGQEKNVTVYKLIAQNTIEEKIQKLQQEKAELSQQVISEETMSLSSMSQEDLAELLR